MSKLSDRAQAMADAMKIACVVEKAYGDDIWPALIKMRDEGRLPYDTPSFQAAYAAICLERDLPNQYLTLHAEDFDD